VPLPRPAARERRLAALVGLGLFVGTVLLFSRSMGDQFVNYDDPRYVTSNAFIQAPFTWESLRWAFGGRLELWQPLTWLSHMADWQLYGDRPAGHHATSILWHALNAVLAFAVIRRLGATLWLGAFAAALYAWHPLRVESVAWVAERKDVMSGFFFFFTLWCYLGYGEARRAGSRARGRYAATLAAYVAGLMCKPTLVTVPLLLLALDAWPLGRVRCGRRAPDGSGVTESAARLIGEKLPFLAAAIAVSVLTMRLQRAGGQFTLDLPLAARLANVPIALVRYLGKLAWPAELTVCYPHPGWWPSGFVVLATVAVAILIGLAWRMRKTQPWLAVGAVWFGVMLLPTIGLVQVGFQSLADRYTYLPALGAEIAVLWTLERWLAVWPAAARIAAGAAVLGAFAVRTWQQQAVWRDSLSLFQHAVAVSNSSPIAEGFLGYTLASLGRYDEAIPHSERALTLDPKNEMAVYTLAEAAANSGRVEDAIRYYSRDLALDPSNVTSEYKLGVQLLRHGELAAAATRLADAGKRAPALIAHNAELAAEAARHGNTLLAALRLQAGLLLQPANVAAHVTGGAGLAALGEPGAARAAFERALVLAPDDAEAHAELGLLLWKEHDTAGAARQLQRALQLSPHLASAAVGLGRIEEELGDSAAADEHFHTALTAEPQNGQIVQAWAEILARRRRFREAAEAYRQAAELRPTDASVRAGLGYALALSGDRAGAAEAWTQALRLDPNFPGLRERLRHLQR